MSTTSTTNNDRDLHSDASERRDAQVRRRQTIRLVVLGVIGVLVTALAVDNAQSVTVSYLIGSATAPLVIALAMALVLGGAVGYLVNSRRQKR